MAQTAYGPVPGAGPGRVPDLGSLPPTVHDVVLLPPGGDVPVTRPEDLGPPPVVRDEPRRTPPTERPLYFLSSVLTIFGVMAITFVATLGPVGAVKHARDQQTAFDTLRGDLANATTVVTQTDDKGRLHPLGTPIAVLDIPQIGLREVVFEGTTSGVLASGPGHRRDSPMPGQPGVSVIFGRKDAYGGPFASVKDLKVGNVFTVTTGQGTQRFRVISVRVAGDPVPPVLAADKSRLMLVTAAGPSWVPEGTLRVDADLVGEVQAAGPRPLTPQTLPIPERPLQGNPSVWIWVLLVSQALFAAAFATTYLRHRWGGWQAWLTGGPLLLALGVALADQVAQLLPNLL